MGRYDISLAQLIESAEYPDIQQLPDACNKIILGVIDGLLHLHNLGLVHGDLKPSNILISTELRSCISDFGVRKHLGSMMEHQSEASEASIGWSAAEVCQGAAATTAADVFALGCVLHFVTFSGEHPFGDGPQRQMNITHGNAVALESQVKHAAVDAIALISSMIQSDVPSRPDLFSIKQHVFLWKAQQKQSFIAVITDYIDAPGQGQQLLAHLDQRSEYLIGGTDWVETLEPIIQDYLCKHRGYRAHSVHDLFRMLSSVHNSTRDLPAPCQRFLSEHGHGQNWEMGYFLTRLRGLLMELYLSVLSLNLQESHPFSQFFLEAY
jgi:serine/threonine protein kinase